MTDTSIVKTKYWHLLNDGRVQCDLCPRECKLHEGQQGLCFVRANQNNELVLTKLDAAIDLSRDIRNNLREDILKLEGYIDKIDNKVEASSDRIKDTQSSIDGVLENIFSEMNQVQKDVTASIREIEALNRDTEKDV